MAYLLDDRPKTPSPERPFSLRHTVTSASRKSVSAVKSASRAVLGKALKGLHYTLTKAIKATGHVSRKAYDLGVEHGPSVKKTALNIALIVLKSALRVGRLSASALANLGRIVGKAIQYLGEELANKTITLAQYTYYKTALERDMNRILRLNGRYATPYGRLENPVEDPLLWVGDPLKKLGFGGTRRRKIR